MNDPAPEKPPGGLIPDAGSPPVPQPLPWTLDRVAIIGVGLLGGSFGLGIRSLFPDSVVVGVSRNESSRRAALASGTIHEATDDARGACTGADLVIVATPVDRIAQCVIDAADVCRDDAIVTDLGSTKASIVSEVQSHANGRLKFVGAHPIAGGEKTGAQHSQTDLFRGKTVVLTPTDMTDIERVQRCKSLWHAMGSRVVILSPQAHDQAMASISHVPHLVASLLASLPADDARLLAGKGWLDTTRIASGDPEMWTAICRENRLAILAELERFGHSLQTFRETLLRGRDAELFNLLATAKQVRDSITGR